MIAKLIGARNEIEDVLRASARDGTLLSPAERDRLSAILSQIESLLQDLEEGPPNTSGSAGRHFRPRRRISSSDMSAPDDNESHRSIVHADRSPSASE